MTNVKGSFCWVELGTNDLAKAKGFYGELFGWGFEEMPMEADGETGVYCMLKKGDNHVGGAYELFQDQVKNGVPPNWLSYVAVDDTDAATNKARSLGAMVVVDPIDVQDMGRMSVFLDPTGAPFAIWQEKTSVGSSAYGTPGSPCWFELVTRDLGAARNFYTQLFGWEAQEIDMGGMTYVMLMNGSERAGGMMAATPQHGDVPSHWMIYFSVEDCDAAVTRVSNGGGKVIVPPTDTPPGRFATLLDSAGAAFSTIAMNPDYKP